MEHSNNNGCFEEYFLSRYALVVRVASRYAPSREAVSDIVQEVFFESYQKQIRDKQDFPDASDAFLAATTRNIAIDYWKKHQNQRNAILKLIDSKLMSGQDDGHDLVGEAEHGKVIALKKCIEKLSEKNRKILVEYYWKKTCTEELAEKSGRKESAVHQLLYRIRVKLRDCILSQIDEQER